MKTANKRRDESTPPLADVATARQMQREMAAAGEPEAASIEPHASEAALSGVTVARLQMAWLAVETARQEAEAAHKASAEASQRLHKKRTELETLFRSIFERRPLFDALADEE
jgi:hypothetical protein